MSREKNERRALTAGAVAVTPTIGSLLPGVVGASQAKKGRKAAVGARAAGRSTAEGLGGYYLGGLAGKGKVGTGARYALSTVGATHGGYKAVSNAGKRGDLKKNMGTSAFGIDHGDISKAFGTSGGLGRSIKNTARSMATGNKTANAAGAKAKAAVVRQNGASGWSSGGVAENRASSAAAYKAKPSRANRRQRDFYASPDRVRTAPSWEARSTFRRAN